MATERSQVGSGAAQRVTELLLDSVLSQPVQTLLLPELHARLLVAGLAHALRGPRPLLQQCDGCAPKAR